MIDTDNLRTASLYINNQLLSRGLLRDGDSIDFAGTRRSDEEDAEVSGRIISVLNDLILRRDRDAEHRESLSTSMRAMRAENLKLIADLTRTNDKYAEAQRKADLATRAESATKTQLKSAEANARALKEEVARMRSLVAQSRSCCATEIRRRDRQIDTLKKQLGEAGRSRGTRANPALTTITVTGDIGNEKDNTTTISNSSHYDSELRSETNTTLANLARHLTEENDIMLGVMQQTMAQLRDMSGWVADTKEDEEVRKRPTCEDMAAELDSILDHMRTILTNPSFVPIEEVVTREEEINRLKTGWVKMETRWKDAVHLMDGWRKRMASSGKPVCDEDLQMGMRLSPVRIKDLDLDETRVVVADHGLSAVKEEPEENEAHEFLRSPCPRHAAEEPDYAAGEDFDDVGGDSDSDAANHEHHVPEDEYPVADGSQGMYNRPDQESMHEHEQDESLESTALPGRPQPSPLVNSSSAGNRGFLRNEKLRLGPSHHGSNGDESAPTSESKSMRSQPVRPRALASQSRLPSRVHRPAERPRSPSRTSLDDALLPTKRHVEMPPAPAPPGNDEHHDPVQAADEIDETQNQTCTLTTHSSPTRVESREKPPRDTEPKPAQSPLTMSNIAAKLAASEREADAARVRAKLKAARGSTRGVSRPIVSTSAATATVEIEVEVEAPPDEELASRTRREQQETARDPVKQDLGPSDSLAKPEKRKRDRKVGKTTSRRRSTLSPMELKALISGEAL